jgi:hypothetical protein
MLQYRLDDDQGGPQPPKPPWKEGDPLPPKPGKEHEEDEPTHRKPHR